MFARNLLRRSRMPSKKTLRDKLKPIFSIVGDSVRAELEEALRLAEVGQAAQARLTEIRRLAGDKLAAPTPSTNASVAATPGRKGKKAKTRGRAAAASKAAKPGKADARV